MAGAFFLCAVAPAEIWKNRLKKENPKFLHQMFAKEQLNESDRFWQPVLWTEFQMELFDSD